MLFPAYAEAVRAGSQTLAQVFYGARRWQNLFYMLAIGGIGGGAELIVSLLYDVRYHGVVIYLRLLSISAAFVLANSASEEMIIALGYLRSTAYVTATRLVWLFAGGALAFLLHLPLLMLVLVFGTVEVVAAVFWWIRLYRARLLDWKEEAAGVCAAGLGAAIGYGVSSVVMATVQANFGTRSLHALLRAQLHGLH